MATLTSDELELVRMRIGDNHPDTAQSFDLSDSQIQTQWDRADGHSSDLKAYRAYYYMVELRYGIWINSINTETTDGAKQHQQKVQNIEKLLERYRKLAGLGEFTLPTQSGVLDFDLDQDAISEW